jgi:CRISPR-associated protein Csy2
MSECITPALLVLPRIRIQNANAISSPMTWGFPAMSAFLGAMTALERRMGRQSGIAFRAVGVVCHAFDPQVTSVGYTKLFHLTRNPLLSNGDTAAIVEEGRVHLELTLVFDVLLSTSKLAPAERQLLADQAAHLLAGMRLAGGSVMPIFQNAQQRVTRPTLVLQEEAPEQQQKQFRKLARQCLPGFALVSRDDLLHDRLAELQLQNPQATVLDAWLDLSRWNHHSVTAVDEKGETIVSWRTDKRSGWTVPIPVGYAGLSDLYPPGAVANARDEVTSFRFVETIWSMGQWVSPHRLKNLDDLLWYTQVDGEQKNIYRCRNDFQPPVSKPLST